MKAIWGLRLPEKSGPIREAIVMLYGLAPNDGKPAQRYSPDMTHEFTVYEVSPDTPIDFDRSLFEQKCLAPLLPATVGFQFTAQCDDAAAARLQQMADRIVAETLPPDVSSAWETFFPEGVDITRETVHAAISDAVAKIEQQ